MDDQDEEHIVPIKQLNSLGYYPPARALIIRGTTRYHPAATIKLRKPDGMAVGVPNPRGNGGPIVIGPGGGNLPDPKPKDPVAANPPKDPNANAVAAANAGPGTKPTLIDPKLDPDTLKPKLSSNPKRRWQRGD